MKQAALKRSEPLKRRTRLKQKRATPRRRPEGWRDEAYLAFVRTRSCAATTLCYALPGVYHRCVPITRIEAHHARSVGAGLKDDRCAIPLCSDAHRAWHANVGVFKGWDKAERRAWADAQIAATQRAWAEERGS